MALGDNYWCMRAHEMVSGVREGMVWTYAYCLEAGLGLFMGSLDFRVLLFFLSSEVIGFRVLFSKPRLADTPIYKL